MFFLADAYFHTLSPFAVKFPASWPVAGIRWYGLAYAVGFLLAWGIVRWVAKRGWSPIPAERIGDLMFAVFAGVLVGGRLGYALFYERHLFYTFSNSMPYWDLLAINKGGMASHGGMIGVLLGCWWFGRKYHVSTMHILDVGSLAATPGLFFGRIANFINAELWGKPLPEAMQSNPPSWSVKYPMQIIEHWLAVLQQGRQSNAEYADLISKVADDFHIHASQSELPALVAGAAQQKLDIVQQQLGPVVGVDNLFFERIVDLARDSHAPLHQQVVQTLKPLLTAYYPSQIFQAITDGPILLGLLILIWLRPRKPGVIGGWFLIIYGVLRIITELFRQPDKGIGLTFGLISRGQTLSLLMVLAGVVCLAICVKRDVPRLGGLFRKGPMG